MNDQKKNLLSLALIVILGCIVYANALNGPFIWDDNFLVRDNPLIKNGATLSRIFTSDIGAGVNKKYYSYRPLQMMSYLIDRSLWQLNAKGYHVTNVLLHILTGLCLYWMTSLLYKDVLLSALTALLFIVHPVHTETVAYISSRSDLLAALGLFLTFIFYIKYTGSKKILSFVPMFLSYAAALLSRESALIFPVVALLWHYAFKKKIRLDAFFSILAMASVYVFVRSVFLKETLPPLATVSTSLFQRMPGFFVAIARYVRLLLFPFGLHMEYGNRLFKWSDPLALAGIIVTMGALYYAFRKRKAWPWLFFSVGWFFVTLLPLSNIFPVNAYMAEHWIYVPSVGFCTILAFGLSISPKKKNTRSLALCIVFFLLIFYSCLTIRQNRYWQNEIDFFKRTAKYAPDSSRLYYDFGIACEDNGQIQEAMSAYRKAIALNPSYAEAYNNLAILYFRVGQREESIAFFKKAIEVDPNYKEAYYNLGLAIKKNGGL